MAGIGSTAPWRSCSATAMSSGTSDTTASAASRRLEMRPSAGARVTSDAIDGWSAAAPHRRVAHDPAEVERAHGVGARDRQHAVDEVRDQVHADTRREQQQRSVGSPGGRAGCAAAGRSSRCPRAGRPSPPGPPRERLRRSARVGPMTSIHRMDAAAAVRMEASRMEPMPALCRRAKMTMAPHIATYPSRYWASASPETPSSALTIQAISPAAMSPAPSATSAQARCLGRYRRMPNTIAQGVATATPA